MVSDFGELAPAALNDSSIVRSKKVGAGTIFFFANLDVKKKQAPKERVFGIELGLAR